ncbi:glycosyl hydrolase [Priestia aryabhattai]|nr:MULTISPECIES: glycosyl hydrolase [Priestia]MED3820748.1 glycosyl hydrolase [Priestia aryabhattai]QSF33257.1 hypothetical protein ICR95_25005 [Priestia megaterium]
MFKRLSLLCCAIAIAIAGIIFVKFFNPHNKNTKLVKVYQAESAILKGGNVSREVSGYSGKGYVTNLTSPDASLTFKINVPSSSTYNLNLRYRIPKGSGAKRTKIILNGQPFREIFLTEKNNFEETANKKISLNKGVNIIKIVSDWGYYDIDSLKVSAISKDNNSRIKENLVNINATRETKNLMKFLVENYGRKIISGQQNMEDVEWLNKTIARKPALVGFDFSNYSTVPSNHGVKSHEVEDAIKWHNNGGIVTFSWHWIAPAHQIQWKKGFDRKFTDFDINYAMNNPKSEDYQLLLKDIDKIAFQLKKLQAANVPILFRPLHEAEGGWFWWGAGDPNSTKKLYILLYDRITNYHHINNIIWVWNSSSPKWYPGDKYVDIVSYDYYPGSKDYTTASIQYDRLNSLVNENKLVTLSENGSIPDPDLLEKYKISWSWFLTWKGFLQAKNQNDIEHITKVYSSPYVITLDELPDFSHK